MVAGEPLTAGSRQEKSPNQASNDGGSKVDITEEQRARMEANRLKALQRAAARSKQSSQVQIPEPEKGASI